MKGFISTGLLAGILWGWFSMAANSATGAFPFEGTFVSNWAVFTLAGGLFGLAVAGAMRLAARVLPFKGVIANAVLVSVAFWLALKVGGALLSSMDPDRFHVVTPQTVQGLLLSVVLGALVGLMWKKEGGLVRQ